MRFPRILISVLALATIAAPVWATSTTIYTDQTAFNTATASVFFQNLTFTSANLNQGSSNGLIDPSGVTITDSGGQNSNLTIIGGANLEDLGYSGFAAALPGIVYDFWFTVTGSAYSTVYVSFTAPDGYQSGGYQISGGGTLFFGVTSTAPITGLTFTGAHNETLTAFDFAGSGPADTPEAATLLLIGTGLIAMRFFKKRDQARAKQQPTPPETRPAGFVSPQVAAS